MGHATEAAEELSESERDFRRALMTAFLAYRKAAGAEEAIAGMLSSVVELQWIGARQAGLSPAEFVALLAESGEQVAAAYGKARSAREGVAPHGGAVGVRH